MLKTEVYNYKPGKMEKVWSAIVTESGVKPNGQCIDIYY